MKHDRLCAIGHNLADSLACGLCFIIGVWDIHVFDEAAAGDGSIDVDFLGGKILRGECSEKLRSAVERFADVLPAFCRANGADVTDFVGLTATFQATPRGRCVSLNVTDRSGRNSVTEYAGLPLKRLRILDPLGRVRRKPRQVGSLRRAAVEPVPR